MMEELTSKQEDDLLEEGRDDGADVQDRDESVWADDPTDEDIEKMKANVSPDEMETLKERGVLE